MKKISEKINSAICENERCKLARVGLWLHLYTAGFCVRLIYAHGELIGNRNFRREGERCCSEIAKRIDRQCLFRTRKGE